MFIKPFNKLVYPCNMHRLTNVLLVVTQIKSIQQLICLFYKDKSLQIEIHQHSLMSKGRIQKEKKHIEMKTNSSEKLFTKYIIWGN